MDFQKEHKKNTKRTTIMKIYSARFLVAILSVLLISCQSMQSSRVSPDVKLLLQAIKTSDENYVHWYIANGFDLNQRDADGKTALMHATQQGKVAIAKSLIQAGANLTAKDKRDFDVMFYVAGHNRIEIAQILIDAGYPIQLENESNAQNLIMAMDFKYLELVNLLIDKGKARIDFPNLKEPKSLLVEAILEGTGLPFIESLIERGASINAPHRGRHQHHREIMIDYNPVIAAILVYEPRILTFLTLRGGSTDKINGIERDDDAAYYAIQMDAADLLDIVLNNAIYSNQEKKYHQLLLHAARYCSKCVAVLARDGINPDYFGDNDDQMTPLMHAAWKNNTDQVLLLLKLGAKIDRRDKLGRTALYLAAGNGYLDSVKMLVEHGANTEIGTDKIKSPMLNAINNGHYLTADFLKRFSKDKTDIERLIISREKELFFSQNNLESCREQSIDSVAYEICTESNYSAKIREYQITVKQNNQKVFNQSIKPQDGLNLRYFSISQTPVTQDKVLIGIPEVKGMPNRYEYMVNQYYLLDIKKWQLKLVWTSPKCGYPCSGSIISIQQQGDSINIEHLQKEVGTSKNRIFSFSVPI